MAHFQKFAEGLDVMPLLAQLHVQPDLWNANTMRTERSDSPHRGVPDIWVRTAPEFGPVDAPYIPVFYPAWNKLPALRSIIFPLAARYQASMIGNILITRIPPGGEVLGHTDRGWGPSYFNLKAYVVLASNEGCLNWCEDERVIMQTGDGWFFRNTVEHGVRNAGRTDRLSLIATFRVE